MSSDAPLFAPLALRGTTLRNRVVVSPMQMYSTRDGCIGDWHLAHLGRFALGGAALVMVEATAISPRARSTWHDNGLWNDAHVAAFRRLTSLLHEAGAAAGIQLQHAGRKASTQAPWHGFGPLTDADRARGEAPWRAEGPTTRGWSERYPPTHAMTDDDIGRLLDDYRAAARRALAAGFDVVEIHAAHGYLLHSFLSPLSNTRSDRWGGDRDGRMRLPLAVVAAVREAWPADRPLCFRLSTVDGVGVGWSLDDSVALARRLREAGVDVVDCSSGGMNLPSKAHLVARRPGFQVPFARRVRAEADVATMAVGLIRDPAQANAIVRDGDADLVALAREMLWDPNWPLHAAHALGVDDAWSRWPHQFGWWLARRDRARSYGVSSTARRRSTPSRGRRARTRSGTTRTARSRGGSRSGSASGCRRARRRTRPRSRRRTSAHPPSTAARAP